MDKIKYRIRPGQKIYVSRGAVLREGDILELDSGKKVGYMDKLERVDPESTSPVVEAKADSDADEESDEESDGD